MSEERSEPGFSVVLRPRPSAAREREEAESDARFGSVVEALCSANERVFEHQRGQRRRQPLPSRGMIEGVVDDLRAVLFPWHFGIPDLRAAALRHFIGTRLDRAQAELTAQVRSGLEFACEHGDRGTDGHCRVCDARADQVAEAVIGSLPRVRALLEADATAAYEGDPAARFVDETLFCYPGFRAITQHRIAHELHVEGVPLIPRIIAELSHESTGIDIHPGARIGKSFFIDHGTGVVIGETAEIGNDVKMYQGVTLGALSIARKAQSGYAQNRHKRHPTIGNNVTIYSGAKILGGETVIGAGSIIGGNVWLVESVPPNSRIFGREREPFPTRG
ncbi:MAG TPA: serine O-acetyltransferase EpsC, partial [Polyangiaceae bacterium]